MRDRICALDVGFELLYFASNLRQALVNLKVQIWELLISNINPFHKSVSKLKVAFVFFNSNASLNIVWNVL